MKPEICIDCGATPPDAETSYTAIGNGWRVHARESRGRTVHEWRCATCWLKRRAKESGHPAPVPKAHSGAR